MHVEFIILYPLLLKIQLPWGRIRMITYIRTVIVGTLACITFNTTASYHQHYHVITKLLDQYTRPITLLDVHPLTTMPFHIAATYDGVFVMVDSSSSDQLLNTCKHAGPNIILLRNYLAPYTLELLGDCEHFDVVIACDFVRRCGNAWQETIDKLLELGDHLFIEIPTACPNMKKYLLKKNFSLVSSIPNSELFLISKEKKYLKRRSWNFQCTTRSYSITSTFTTKQMHKTKGGKKSTTPWLPGINLLTFRHMNGIYPERKEIRSMIKPFVHANHNDVCIVNLVIQGRKLVLIDGNDSNAPVTHIRRNIWKLLRYFKN